MHQISLAILLTMLGAMDCAAAQARTSTSFHFSRTMKLGETMRLPAAKEPTAPPWLEIRVDRFDETIVAKKTAPVTTLRRRRR